MRRLLHPFVLVVSTILVLGYAYIAARLTSTPAGRAALAAPFLMVWILPAIYWTGARDRPGRIHEWVQALSYLCMGWLSFLLVFTVGRDVLLAVSAALPPLAAAHTLLDESGGRWVPLAALAAVSVGALAALRGPHVRHVDIPVEGLAPDLDGFRIVQISDLHAGPTMRRAYVQRVVDMTNELAPDLIALTGDIVDGPVPRLGPRVAPLAALTSGERAFFVLGNHDYYSGAAPWTTHFEAMGFRVLRNAHVTIERGGARLLIGGVVDFAARLY
ncbi:MAG TPA: metallophosphoesterase, partial [Methylomirabilota bacterium]